MQGEMTKPIIQIGSRLGFLTLLLMIVAFAGHPTYLAQGLAVACIIIVCAHAVAAIGWVEALAFAGICLTVTFTIENIGVRTGFPFGHYAFLVGGGLPHIGDIPLIVGPLYFGMGYPSWVIANLLVGERVERPTSVLQLFAVPLTAAFVMVQWDVVMDPANSTLARAWIWYDGGGYFGVPLSNFFGWFIVTYLYFQVFAILLYRRRTRPPVFEHSASFWAVPILLYLAAGLCHVPSLLDPDMRLVDQSHRTWSESDLHETGVIVMLFTMLPTSLLALLRLKRSPIAP